MKSKELTVKKTRGVKLQRFEGYCFAKLNAIGTRSEGPEYYLQLESGKAILIQKKVHPWKNDPVLHTCLGKKVVLLGKTFNIENGEVAQIGITYTKVLNTDSPLTIDLKLNVKEDTLWINKMPGPAPTFPTVMKNMAINLSVQWPYKDIWKGKCPTSQVYDFWIEDSKGNTIWNWGNCMLFRDKKTEVVISGGSPVKVKAPWAYFDESITVEGLYVARAKFIASGQEIKKPFLVKFAR